MATAAAARCCHAAYLRLLALLASPPAHGGSGSGAGSSRLPPRPAPARNPLLRLAQPDQLPALLPFTHPISACRSRSFEGRCLELRYAVLAPSCEQVMRARMKRIGKQMQMANLGPICI